MTQETRTTPEVDRLAKDLPPPEQTNELFGSQHPLETPEMLMDRIEMLGEEQAAGFLPPQHSEVSAGMRYLHCSRTISQLINDRNRAVGLYLAVASLMWTASAAMLNAKVETDLIIPLREIQRWCLPVTFGVLAMLSLFIAFLLIRTRAGLIYEAAKMNALLGLPVGRVQRINPLSIFFIMHAMISIAGGTCAALFSVFMLRVAAGMDLGHLMWPGIAIGIGVTVFLIVLYMATVSYITSDRKLQALQK